MPHSGGATFFQLKKINAKVKVLIASGYAKDGQIREMIEQGCSGFIQKPFGINELSQKIMKVLNVIMSEIEKKAKDIKKAEPLLTSRSLCLYD